MKRTVFLSVLAGILNLAPVSAQKEKGSNPVIYADVPDISMVRVGDAYYMSSTTMHMAPGVPVMKSTDLTNWKLVSYCYDVLEPTDEMSLNHGKNAYGAGSWASCIRHHNGRFYVSTFSHTTGKTYIYSTTDIENGAWQKISFSPAYHDHTLFFDDDGHTYLIWGGGKLHIVELKEDLSGVKEGTERVLIENANAPANQSIRLPAEGSQLFKKDGKYYLFNISWPNGGMRTVIVHRADRIDGPWEGKVVLQDQGVAQGGMVETPQGEWYAYLFQDRGSVGRIPYLVPMTWQDGWPVLGINGKVPETLDLPAGKGPIPGIVASDEFKRKKKEKDLPLVWQWNHNPDNALWSVREREGYLRLKTGRIETDLLQARNTLTQRTFGPTCQGSTAIDVSGMKEGDHAGLMLLQRKYAWVGVVCDKNGKRIVMVNAQNDKPKVMESLPLAQETVYLKAVCDFRNLSDVADFYYSTDGRTWTKIGNRLHMEYSMPHFMGYRFGLFNYATKAAGGYTDFDFFHIEEGMQ